MEISSWKLFSAASGPQQQFN